MPSSTKTHKHIPYTFCKPHSRSSVTHSVPKWILLLWQRRKRQRFGLFCRWRVIYFPLVPLNGIYIQKKLSWNNAVCVLAIRQGSAHSTAFVVHFTVRSLCVCVLENVLAESTRFWAFTCFTCHKLAKCSGRNVWRRGLWNASKSNAKCDLHTQSHTQRHRKCVISKFHITQAHHQHSPTNILPYYITCTFIFGCGKIRKTAAGGSRGKKMRKLCGFHFIYLCLCCLCNVITPGDFWRRQNGVFAWGAKNKKGFRSAGRVFDATVDHQSDSI